jgi:hypothetical protein
MELINHIHNAIFSWNHFLIVYVVLLVLDTALLLYTKKYKPLTKSLYFRWHQQHGLLQVTLFKMLFIAFNMDILLTVRVTGAFTFGIQLYYGTIIFLAFKQIYFNTPCKELTLPEQYKAPKEGPKWNWGAFIIPEFWFMWHEIMGISFISIFLDAVIFLSLSKHLDNSLLTAAIFLLIRLVFGLKGNNLYYAKYGTWPK